MFGWCVFYLAQAAVLMSLLFMHLSCVVWLSGGLTGVAGVVDIPTKKVRVSTPPVGA